MLRHLADVLDGEQKPVNNEQKPVKSEPEAVNNEQKPAENEQPAIGMDVITKTTAAQSEEGDAAQQTTISMDVISKTTAAQADEEEAPAGNDQTSTTSTQATTAPAGDVDASGMPWDARIHAGTKTMMKSGKRKNCWKYKPGVSDEEKASVEAELMGNATPPAAQQTQTQQPVAQPDTPAQGGEAAADEIFNQPGHWPKLLKMMTGDVEDKKMPQGVAVLILQDMGFENVMQLAPTPDRYQEFANKWIALRNMIVLDPSYMDKAVQDWAAVGPLLGV
jgi:hypothetical protein